MFYVISAQQGQSGSDNMAKTRRKPSVSSLSNAEKCKRYREARKHDANYNQKEKQRKQDYRKRLSEMQLARNRELAKLRMRKHRAQQAQQPTKNLEKEKKETQPNTRKRQGEQRKVWKEAKRKYRANMSSQKKRRVRERDRERYYNKASTSGITKIKIAQSKNNTSTENECYPTPSATRKAVSRIRQKLPENPQKFSAIINGLVKNATPKKRKALNEAGLIMTPSKKHKLCLFENTMEGFKETYHRLKASRKKKDLRQRRIMASHLARLKKYRQLRKGSSAMGVRWKTFIRWSKLDFSVLETKRKDSLQPKEHKKIEEFYINPEISVTHAGKRTVLRKINKQRQTLRRSLRASYNIFRKENPSSKLSFSKFAQLRPRHVKTQKHTQMDSCLCEKCVNLEMMLKGLKHQDITNKFEASRLSLCSYPEGELPSLDCAKRKCKKCGIEKLAELLESEMESTVPVVWYEWSNQKVELPKGGETKNKKILVENRAEKQVLIRKFLEALKPFTYHLFCSSWQHRQFAQLKADLREGQVLSVLDFAENYTTSYQDECQSAHWAKKQITIHPVVNYYAKTDGDKSYTKTFEQVFISDDVKHDYHVVHKVVEQSLEQLKAECQIQQVIQFTDGCSAQYKSKIPFMDVSFGEKDFGAKFERNYFGSGHGKGPADGCSGVVKSSVSRAVKGRVAVVRNAAEFFDYCKEHLTKDTDTFKRSFLFLPSTDINREREDRMDADTVQGTRDLHCVRAIRPGQIAVRSLTCCCLSCLDGDGDECPNKAVVEPFRKRYTSRQAAVELIETPPPQAELQTSDDPFLSRNDYDKDLTDGLLGKLDFEKESGGLNATCTYKNNELSSTDNITFTYPNTVEEAIQIIAESTDIPTLADFMSTGLDNNPVSALGYPGSEGDTDHAVVDVDLACSLPVDMPSTSSPPENDRYMPSQSIQRGNFVEVRIPCGRKFRNFIGLVDDICGTNVQLRFMEATEKNGLKGYRWPSNDDQSLEPSCNILRILPEPKLVDNLSTNRVQFFIF